MSELQMTRLQVGGANQALRRNHYCTEERKTIFCRRIEKHKLTKFSTSGIKLSNTVYSRNIRDCCSSKQYKFENTSFPWRIQWGFTSCLSISQFSNHNSTKESTNNQMGIQSKYKRGLPLELFNIQKRNQCVFLRNGVQSIQCNSSSLWRYLNLNSKEVALL